MFSGHITIQYMFCMFFMIKKIILEGFNDRGGANVRGRSGKHFKKTTNNKNNFNKSWNKRCTFGFFSTYTGREPTIFCMRGFCYILYRSGMVPAPGEPYNEGLTMKSDLLLIFLWAFFWYAGPFLKLLICGGVTTSLLVNALDHAIPSTTWGAPGISELRSCRASTIKR